jgi:hypothetical protein
VPMTRDSRIPVPVLAQDRNPWPMNMRIESSSACLRLAAPSNYLIFCYWATRLEDPHVGSMINSQSFTDFRLSV